MTFRSGAATVASRFERSLRPRRTANSGVTFPIHNDEEHDGDRIAVPPMPACAGRSACLLFSVVRDAAPEARAGGGERNRTDDLLLAKQALSRLSYTPRLEPGFRAAAAGSRSPAPKPALRMVGLGRFELPTSRLSGVRSNRLSYRPVLSACRSWFVAARMPRKGVSAACAGDPAPQAALGRGRDTPAAARGICKAIRNFLAETPESLERR